MDTNWNEILLTRAEMVYLLDSTKSSRVAGMEIPEFSLPQEQFNQVLLDGKDQLTAKGLIISDSGGLDPRLQIMVETLVRPSLAAILVRGIRSLGQQLYIFNFSGDLIVEHTLPAEGLHRLMLLETLEEFYERMYLYVPLSLVDHKGCQSISIRPNDMVAIQKAISGGDLVLARSKLAGLNLPAEWVEPFLKAMSQPDMNFELTVLLIADQKIVSGDSISIVADQQSSWGFWPAEKEDEYFLLPAGVNDLLSAVEDGLEALAGITS